VGWAGALGAMQAVSYWQARRPEDSGRLIATWFALAAPLGLVCIGIGEAILPEVLAAQSDSTLHLAQLFLPTVLLIPLGEVVWGVLLGDQDFLFVNVMRFAQPAVVALGYVVLWAADALTVVTGLLTAFFVGVLALAVAATRMFRRHRLTRPSLKLARTTLWYALRAHGTNVTGMANMRLDLLLIPAFLTAASVGLYSVATNVSWIVPMLAGALAALVLPAAARERERGTATVLHALRVTLALGAALALVLALVAEVGVRLIYGAEFEGAVTALRILLPGSVLLAGAGVLQAGLYALNRPLTAGAAGVAGVAVTIVGLLLFLRAGGINAAAIVSTVSYAVVFLVAFELYRRAAGLSMGALAIRERQHHPDSSAGSGGRFDSEGDDRSPRFSVVVPSYGRPQRLRGCLAALGRQTHPATEVIVVLREDDHESRTLLSELSLSDSSRRVMLVRQPGLVPSLRAGITQARGDVIALTDDDTEPQRDWLERMASRFLSDDHVGAVGGRDIVRDGRRGVDEDADPVPERVELVGRVRWFGRTIGNHHLESGLQEVDFLKGANMAVRRDLICVPDLVLRGRGATVAWDLELSLAVSTQGWKVIYDPSVLVDHYPAVRQPGDERAHLSRSSLSDATFNELYVVLKLVPWWQKPMVGSYAILVGTRRAPGLVLLLEGLVRGKASRDLVGRFRISTQARLAAMLALARPGHRAS